MNKFTQLGDCSVRGAIVAMLVCSFMGALVIGTSSTVQAQSKLNPDALSYEFSDRSLKAVLKEISSVSGTNVVLKEGQDAKISLSVSNLRWDQVVELIAIQYGYIIDKKAQRLWFLSAPAKISMEFKDADIRTVVELIASKIGWNFVIDPDVQGVVTLKFDNVPWKQALDVVLQTGNYKWIENDNKIVMITTEAKMLRNMTTKVIRLKYLKPRGEAIEANLISEVERFATEAETSAEENSGSFALLSLLSEIKSSAGRISYDAFNNALVITDSPTIIKKMEEIIVSLDIRPAQILIDTKMVDASVQDLVDLGTEWANGFSIQSDGFGSVTTGFPIKGGYISDVLNHIGQHQMNLDMTQSQFVMRALKQKGNSKVVQSPQITTLDNQKAMIFVGQTIRFAESTTTVSETGVPTTTFSEASNSPVSIGNMLMVIPHVIKETSEILMDVVPYESKLERFDTFGGGALSLPQTAENVVITKMIIKDGRTGVIGGRTTHTKGDVSNGIPFFGKIPVVGWLFRNKRSQDDERKLLIFITPTIIKGDEGVEFASQVKELRKNAVNEQQVDIDKPRNTSKPKFKKSGPQASRRAERQASAD